MSDEHGLRPFDMPLLTAEQEAQLRRDFDETMRLPFTHRVVQPNSLPLLTPNVVRQLLRECVTVVRPGETLVVQVPMDTRPAVVNELQRAVNDICEDRGYVFGVLIVPGDRLGVAEDSSDEE